MFKKGLFFFGLILPLCAQAQLTARQRAFAGGGGLSPLSIDGVFHNPAALSLEADLSLGLGYGVDSYKKTSNSRSAYAWVKDSVFGSFNTRKNRQKRKARAKDQGFPLAASLIYEDFKGPLSLQKNYHLALSKVFMRRASLGILATHSDFKSRFSGSGERLWVGGVGFLYWLSPKWILGLSAKNIIQSPTSSKRSERLRLSSSYDWNFFKVFLDLEGSSEGSFFKEDLAGGGALEVKVKRRFTLVLSAFNDPKLRGMRLGGGISFLGPRLKVHYGLGWQRASSDYSHSIDFVLPL